MHGAWVRRSVVVLVTVAGATTVSLAAALARPSSPPANCAHQTNTGDEIVPAHYNVVVGPLSFLWLARYATPPLNKRPGYWIKSGVHLLYGHTVTVKITGNARLSTGFVGYGREDGRTTLADSRGSVTFTACGPRHATSTLSTYWSGGFAAPPTPACIPLYFYVDHSRVPRRVVISLAAGTCPGAH